MDKIQRRKEISDFAVKLRLLIKIAPDGYARRDLNRTLHNMRQRYVLSATEKRTRILELLESGLTTYQQLLSELHISPLQLQKNLSILLNEKKIRIEKMRRTSGAGRPQICYFINSLTN